MYRGSTPKITITTNIDFSTCEQAYISFYQKGIKRFEKTLEDCTIEGTKLSFTLTQRETMSLTHGSNVRVQLRAKLSDGTIKTSNIKEYKVNEILKDEII